MVARPVRRLIPIATGAAITAPSVRACGGGKDSSYPGSVRLDPSAVLSVEMEVGLAIVPILTYVTAA